MSIREEIAQVMSEQVVRFDEPSKEAIETWQIAWLLCRSEAFDEAGARAMVRGFEEEPDARRLLRTFLLTDGLDHTIVKQIKALLPSLREGADVVNSPLHSDLVWEVAFLAECLRAALAECRLAIADEDVATRMQLERELANHDQLSANLDAMVLAVVGAHAMDALIELGRLRHG